MASIKYLLCYLKILYEKPNSPGISLPVNYEQVPWPNRFLPHDQLQNLGLLPRAVPDQNCKLLKMNYLLGRISGIGHITSRA